MNGGYVMVDCGGLDLTTGSTAVTIAGIWDMAEKAIKSGKPIMAHNTKYGTGNPVTPVPCFGWYISSTEIVMVGATIHVHIKNDNTVTTLDVAGS